MECALAFLVHLYQHDLHSMGPFSLCMLTLYSLGLYIPRPARFPQRDSSAQALSPYTRPLLEPLGFPLTLGHAVGYSCTLLLGKVQNMVKKTKEEVIISVSILSMNTLSKIYLGSLFNLYSASDILSYT